MQLTCFDSTINDHSIYLSSTPAVATCTTCLVHLGIANISKPKSPTCNQEVNQVLQYEQNTIRQPQTWTDHRETTGKQRSN